mmetsp:Transcript_8271/g.17992  ORF Transcript_8271/g.17992 Transcript_8271/m.17992 type:complete len:258 (+) Transcript_8271:83-856(+)
MEHRSKYMNIFRLMNIHRLLLFISFYGPELALDTDEFLPPPPLWHRPSSRHAPTPQQQTTKAHQAARSAWSAAPDRADPTRSYCGARRSPGVPRAHSTTRAALRPRPPARIRAWPPTPPPSTPLRRTRRLRWARGVLPSRLWRRNARIHIPRGGGRRIAASTYTSPATVRLRCPRRRGACGRDIPGWSRRRVSAGGKSRQSSTGESPDRTRSTRRDNPYLREIRNRIGLLRSDSRCGTPLRSSQSAPACTPRYARHP